MTFFLLWNTKEDILKNVDNPNTFSVPIYFHCMDKKTKKSVGTETGIEAILKLFFFFFFFWVKYPFRFEWENKVSRIILIHYIVLILIHQSKLEKLNVQLALLEWLGSHIFSFHRPRRIDQILSLPWTPMMPLMMMRENVWRSRHWPKSLKANT